MTKSEILQVAKPILFNTEKVRAIMDGRKTATRRVMKPQPVFHTARKYIFADDVYPKKWEDCDNFIKTYQYQPGDFLYVRETFRLIDFSYIDGKWSASVQYKSDNAIGERLQGLSQSEKIGWRPSIHMPKEAARIFLKVTDVRVERLQEITDEEAEKEGCNDYSSTALGLCYIWDSTIKKQDLGKYGWTANPWVWVIEFV